MCSHSSSGRLRVSQHWYWPGRGGADASAVVPAIFIPNVGSQLGKQAPVPAARACSHPFHAGVLMILLSALPRRLPGISWERGSNACLVFLFDTKGALIMSPFPLADCCKLLAIDAKTLHRWLSHANMSLH